MTPYEYEKEDEEVEDEYNLYLIEPAARPYYMRSRLEKSVTKMDREDRERGYNPDTKPWKWDDPRWGND